MLSFPLLVMINHTNIKLAVRRAKIGLFHLSHIICVSTSFVAICPPNRRIFWDMASKHTKGCFLQPNRTCFEFKQLLSNVSLTKFPRNRVI